jgi:hypothetical protein
VVSIPFAFFFCVIAIKCLSIGQVLVGVLKRKSSEIQRIDISDDFIKTTIR